MSLTMGILRNRFAYKTIGFAMIGSLSLLAVGCNTRLSETVLRNSPGINITASSTPLNGQESEAKDFERKVACAQFKDSAEQKISAYNRQQKMVSLPQKNTLSEDDPEQTFGIYVGRKEFIQVFYSPKLNTCLYEEEYRWLLKKKACTEADGCKDYWLPSTESHSLFDVLSGAEIEEVRTIWRSEPYQTQQDVKNMLEEYQNTGR